MYLTCLPHTETHNEFFLSCHTLDIRMHIRTKSCNKLNTVFDRNVKLTFVYYRRQRYLLSRTNDHVVIEQSVLFHWYRRCYSRSVNVDDCYAHNSHLLVIPTNNVRNMRIRKRVDIIDAVCNDVREIVTHSAVFFISRRDIA